MAPCPDLIVLGSGPAACAAAVAARGRGMQVRLIGPAPVHAQGSLELLAGRARIAMAQLGLPQPGGYTCARLLSRWEARVFLQRDGQAKTGGAGLIIDRAWFDPLLLQAAIDAGAQHQTRRVTDADWDPALPVIVATGRRLPRFMSSATAPWTRGISQWAWQAGRSALCGALVVDRSDDGWWYALGDDAGTTVAYCSWDKAMDDVQWAAKVRASDWLPAAWSQLRPRNRPAVTGPGPIAAWHRVPVGDSALSVDPLTGHGLVFALESASQAIDAVAMGATGIHHYNDWLQQRKQSYLQERGAFFDEVNTTLPLENQLA